MSNQGDLPIYPLSLLGDASTVPTSGASVVQEDKDVVEKVVLEVDSPNHLLTASIIFFHPMSFLAIVSLSKAPRRISLDLS